MVSVMRHAKVKQPPGDALAVPGLPVILPHHEAIRSNGGEQAQAPQTALRVHSANRYIVKTTTTVAQQILNGSCSADPHDLVTHLLDRPRQCGLANPQFFQQFFCRDGAFGQLQADAVGVGRHDLNGLMNR